MKTKIALIASFLATAGCSDFKEYSGPSCQGSAGSAAMFHPSVFDNAFAIEFKPKQGKTQIFKIDPLTKTQDGELIPGENRVFNLCNYGKISPPAVR